MKYYNLVPNKRVTFNLMKKIMEEHGMTFDDYNDFLTEYGKKEVYETNDIRHFLGY